MKYSKFVAPAVTTGILWLPAIAAAIEQQRPQPPTTLDQLLTWIGNIANTAFAVLLVLAVVMFVVGAFYYLFSGQKEENKTKGRQFLQYGVIAIVVGVLAFGLGQIVVNLLVNQGRL